MPAFTNFNSAGKLPANTANRSVAAGATENALLYNYSGSAIDVVFGLATDVRGGNSHVIRASGERIPLEDDGQVVTVDKKEVLYVSIANAGTGAQTWNLEADTQSVHNLSLKSGVGHTDLHDDLSTGLYLGII